MINMGNPMMRTMLRRTIGMLVVLAVVMPVLPQLAIASGRDEAMDLADTIRALGYPDQAWQIEQVVVGLSDSELELLDHMDLGVVNEKLEDYIAMKKQVDAMERLPITSSNRSLQDFDLVNLDRK